jgi:dTDP-4-amino-4,6-dideoxy-D-galactose acyltransferase
LSPEALARIGSWAAGEAIECLYFLADAGDPETVRLAEAGGFGLVDVRVTLERRRPRRPRQPPSAHGLAVVTSDSERHHQQAMPPVADSVSGAPLPPAVQIRAALPADIPELRRIAAASHHDSRFYHDPHFERRRCDELYAVWIEKSCADPAGKVLVAEAASQGLEQRQAVAGYITAATAPAGGGQIGLFAVDAAAQGIGVGGQLVSAALEWLDEQGADPVTVVTQGRNVRAQRIYQRFGMLTRSVELWYHRWRPADV